MQIIDILLTQLCFMCSEYQLIQRHNYRRAQSQWELTLNPRWRRPQTVNKQKNTIFQRRVKAPLASMMAWHRRPNDPRQIGYSLLV